MQPDEIYAPTAQGASELRNGATRLTPDELRVLVRLDGALTLGQLTAGLSAQEFRHYGEILRHLRDRNLVAPVEVDPFTLQWNANLSSLQRAGFSVQFARQRPRRIPQPGQRFQVIVVEDDPLLARFTQTLLSLSDFDVRVAGNRAEIVAEIRRPPRPDLILLDLVLPDADGFDILARVRQHPVLKDVPVLLLTGRATREAVLQGLALGADGYLTKPFEPDALLHAVRTVLGLPDEEAPKAWGGTQR